MMIWLRLRPIEQHCNCRCRDDDLHMRDTSEFLSPFILWPLSTAPPPSCFQPPGSPQRPRSCRMAHLPGGTAPSTRWVQFDNGIARNGPGGHGCHMHNNANVTAAVAGPILMATDTPRPGFGFGLCWGRGMWGGGGGGRAFSWPDPIPPSLPPSLQENGAQLCPGAYQKSPVFLPTPPPPIPTNCYRKNPPHFLPKKTQ